MGSKSIAVFKLFARHPSQADEQRVVEFLIAVGGDPFAPPMLPLRCEATVVPAEVTEGFCKVIQQMQFWLATLSIKFFYKVCDASGSNPLGG